VRSVRESKSFGRWPVQELWILMSSSTSALLLENLQSDQKFNFSRS
jgi:hypothetical protein